MVAFLASDDARHVTGVGWLIDGGQTMQSWANAPDAEAYPLVRRLTARPLTGHGLERSRAARSLEIGPGRLGDRLAEQIEIAFMLEGFAVPISTVATTSLIIGNAIAAAGERDAVFRGDRLHAVDASDDIVGRPPHSRNARRAWRRPPKCRN